MKLKNTILLTISIIGIVIFCTLFSILMLNNKPESETLRIDETNDNRPWIFSDINGITDMTQSMTVKISDNLYVEFARVIVDDQELAEYFGLDSGSKLYMSNGMSKVLYGSIPPSLPFEDYYYYGFKSNKNDEWWLSVGAFGPEPLGVEEWLQSLILQRS